MKGANLHPTYVIPIENTQGIITYSDKSLKSSYHSEEYSRSSDIKMAERERVFNYITSKVSTDKPVRYLGLPGKYWYMEHMLCNHYPDIEFLGIDKSYAIVERYANCMPCMNKRYLELYPNLKAAGSVRNLKRESIRFGDVLLDCHKTRNSSWLAIDFSSFLQLFTSSFGQTQPQMRRYLSRFAQNNCAWLDFTGPFHSELDKSWKYLDFHFSPKEKIVPIVITVMYGRDTIDVGKGLEGRSEYLEKSIPGYKVQDSWFYNGLNGCRMATFCGVIIRD